MSTELVQLLFVDLAIIILAARICGALAVRLHQPPVVGEIVAGILLGPTLFSGAVSDALFPADMRMVLSGLADVGVALFMFVMGMELEARRLRGRGRIAAGAVTGSLVLPFGLGVGMAFLLAPRHAPAHFGAFVVFTALAVSVTALPVLARILSDRGLMTTQIGALAMSTASVGDVVAWSAVAGVQAWVAGSGDRVWRVALIVPFVLVVLLVVRPLLRRLLGGSGQGLTGTRFAVVLIGLLLSAAATEAMGMHFIFGAFLFGLAMPRADPMLRAEAQEKVGHLTVVLLPVFFVIAGLKVDLGELDVRGAAELALILAVAIVGKLGGTYLGARSQGLGPRPSGVLAALVNTRGLTELVILGVGLQLGLLSAELYSMMVVMALVTTAMTGPLLSLFYRKPVEIDVADPPLSRRKAAAKAPN